MGNNPKNQQKKFHEIKKLLQGKGIFTRVNGGGGCFSTAHQIGG